MLLDPLTGVLNRRGFDQRLAALIGEPELTDRSHTLVMINIDHFKKVNDTLGHVPGDQGIRCLAELLRRSVPEGEQRVARYGGEEFALLLPGTSAAEGARPADAMRQQIGAMKIRDWLIRATRRWATALEIGRVRVAVDLWRLHSETSHRRHEFLIARMAESGRDCLFATNADSSHSIRRGLNDRSPRARTQHPDPDRASDCPD